MVLNKTPILKVCWALKAFPGISIDHWCFPKSINECLPRVMAWTGCAQIVKILAENAALWLKSVVFR